MSEEITEEEVTEEITVEEVTEEEQAEAWATYVRDELNSILDIYLPASMAGNVGIRYGNPEMGKMEDGSSVFDTTKANTVLINIVLRFEEPIDMPE